MFDQKLLRAPLNNAVMSQRVLKRSVARQASQVMAFLVLAKKCNAANERFRARPKLPESLRHHCIVQRCPRFGESRRVSSASPVFFRVARSSTCSMLILPTEK